MNLQTYLGVVGAEQPLPKGVAEIFEEPTALDLTEPLSQNRPALRLSSYEDLRGLILARYRWIRWRERVDAVQAARAEAGKPLLQSEQVDATTLPHEVSAVDRAVNGGADAKTLLVVFQQAMEVALAQSHAIGAVVKGHPRALQYKSFAGDLGTPAETDAERWLELRRGVRSDAVELSWQHATEALAEVAADHAEALGGIEPAAFVTGALVPWLDAELESYVSLLKEEALALHLAERYQALLEAAPAKSSPLGAVYVGTDRQRVGLSALDKRGGVAATAPLRPSGDWPDRVMRWMKDHRVKMLSIPSAAPAEKWLQQLVGHLETQKIRTTRVEPAGIVEARSIDDPALRRVSPEEASAIVLARRASRPMDEWCRVDPVRLGLSRVQAELDADRLRELLQMVRERTIAAGQPLSTAPVNTGGIRSRQTAPLNPTISSIRDLRPGLQLQGQITNVTKFGAFVNVGLKQEGLVHISELADEFVSDPNEVVQVGQQVSCRVISVDLDRGRIALSMRSENAMPRPGMRERRQPPRRDDRPRASSQRSGSASPDKGSGPGAGGAERNRALADLENLFRK